MRNLELRRPIVFLDLETTGLNVATDRIVEIALIKLHPDGRQEALVRRVNPGVPIPAEATRIHGITDADVAGEPRFAELAPELLSFIGDADIGGFNIARFDIPILQREISTSGERLEISGRAVVDAQAIFHRMEPRDLSAAYMRFCGKRIEGLHSAAADVEACIEVLDGQLDAYPDLPRTPRAIADYLNPRDPNGVDAEGKFLWRDGTVVFGFGKKRGQPLSAVADDDPGYLRWILDGDFAEPVKEIVRSALEGRMPERTPLGFLIDASTPRPGRDAR